LPMWVVVSVFMVPLVRKSGIKLKRANRRDVAYHFTIACDTAFHARMLPKLPTCRKDTGGGITIEYTTM